MFGRVATSFLWIYILILLTLWLMNMVKCICIEMSWRVTPKSFCCLFQVWTGHRLPWSKFDCYFVSHRLGGYRIHTMWLLLLFVMCSLPWLVHDYSYIASPHWLSFTTLIWQNNKKTRAGLEQLNIFNCCRTAE